MIRIKWSNFVEPVVVASNLKVTRLIIREQQVFASVNKKISFRLEFLNVSLMSWYYLFLYVVIDNLPFIGAETCNVI